MQKYKKYVVIIFVIIFSILKLVNLHCYTHKIDHGEGKPCQVCELVLLNNSTPLLLNEAIVFDVLFTNVKYYISFSYYPVTIVSKNIVPYFFSRPPPFLSK